MKPVPFPTSSGKKAPPKPSKPKRKEEEVSEELVINPRKQKLLSVSQSSNDKALVPVVNDETLAVLKSKFGDKSDVIVDMLEYGEEDGAITLVLRTLLQTLVSLLPVVEDNVRKSNGQRGIHGFNMTVSQLRELIADVQAVRDKGMLGQHIVERYVRPSFMDIAVQIVTGLARLEASARAKMSKDDATLFSKELLDVKTGLANYTQTQYKDVSENVIRSLS